MLDAATCSTTGEPGTSGKLGVISTITWGGMGSSVARKTEVCETLSSPSITENWIGKSPICVGPGVQDTSPVCVSSVAPLGKPATANDRVVLRSGSLPINCRLNG